MMFLHSASGHRAQPPKENWRLDISRGNPLKLSTNTASGKEIELMGGTNAKLNLKAVAGGGGEIVFGCAWLSISVV